MTTFKFGDQAGQSSAEFVFISSGGQSDVTVGDQHDSSHRTVKVIDLNNGEDLQLLVNQLKVLIQELQNRPDASAHLHDLQAVREAVSHAENSAGQSAMNSLARAGKWTLDIATKIGVPVATAAIKQALGY
jgi:hypothetical protein